MSELLGGWVLPKVCVCGGERGQFKTPQALEIEELQTCFVIAANCLLETQEASLISGFSSKRLSINKYAYHVHKFDRFQERAEPSSFKVY